MVDRKEKIISASAKARDELGKLDEKVAHALRRIYESARADVQAFIRVARDADGLLAVTAYQRLLNQIERRLQELSEFRNNYLRNILQTAAEMGVNAFDGAVLNPPISNLADQAVELCYRFQAADGLQLSERIWRIDAGAREEIGTVLQQALAQGADVSRTVREFLKSGVALSDELRALLKAAGVDAVAERAGAVLLTDESGAYWKAKRVFRTELNRAHGEAYKAGVRNTPGAAGVRFLLSPNHPRRDICDMHSRINKFGLGPGVYPVDQCPWPAHPNTLSFVEIVFWDEISDADRQPDEPLEWLKSQPPQVQNDILGQNKGALLRTGRLDAGGITVPWRDLRA